MSDQVTVEMCLAVMHADDEYLQDTGVLTICPDERKWRTWQSADTVRFGCLRQSGHSNWHLFEGLFADGSVFVILWPQRSGRPRLERQWVSKRRTESQNNTQITLGLE